MKKTKAKREYIELAECSINAIHSAIDCFNRVYGKHKVETTLILLTNAWELLGKSILLKSKRGINSTKEKDKTIPAEIVIKRLQNLKLLDQHQSDLLQQVISLRNAAIHYLLPKIPQEIQHHLLYFSCKAFKELVLANFKQYAHLVESNFLSITFDEMTTYADKIQKIVGRLRRGNDNDKKLIWLLERGVRFDESSEYLSQEAFERCYKSTKKIMPHLKLNNFVSKAEMVRVVAIQAPRGYSADIKLSKSNNKTIEGLPVITKRTQVEDDYPYLTSNLAKILGKNNNFIANTILDLKLKNNLEYHQGIRSSSSSVVNRYTNQTLSFLRKFLEQNPGYTPYKNKIK